jgi:hypothetical protein
LPAPINVMIVVDVSSALSHGTLETNLYMMDTSFKSTNQGTGRLATACHPGQQINWIIRAIDVQTPILIKGIVFLDEDGGEAEAFGPSGKPAAGEEPRFHYWSGIVPCHLPIGSYRYRLTIQMGKGKASVLRMDAPSLNVMAYS